MDGLYNDSVAFKVLCQVGTVLLYSTSSTISL